MTDTSVVALGLSLDFCLSFSIFLANLLVSIVCLGYQSDTYM